MSKARKKNKPHYPALWFAVQYNNIKLVENLLETGAIVNEVCGRDRGTVLHLAAKKGSTEIVKVLLESGADVKKRDRFGNTPLHAGAKHEPVALELLKHKADINAKNAMRETPLHHITTSAIFIKHSEIRKECLNTKDINGQTALFKAVKNKRYDVIEAILKAGADVNQECGIDLEIVLHAFFKRCSTEAVKLLLENGADLSKRDKSGHTPLHRGANNGTALELMKYNADVNAKNDLHETPLHLAIDFSYPSSAVVEAMIARGIDLEALDINGETVIFRAAKRHFMWTPNCDFIKFLINSGANVDRECGKDCETVLHVAAEMGHMELVRLLLENGAEVNKRDRFGNTPLHRGARHEGIALELMKYNAEVNVKNSSSETPLHFAESAEVVKNLLKRGVDLHALDINGETALFRATARCSCRWKRGVTEVAIALIKAGANMNQKCGKDCETVLHVAAKEGSEELVEIFLRNGADVRKRDGFGNTPLHRGISHWSVARRLREYNANVHVHNIFSENPLHYDPSEAMSESRVTRGLGLRAPGRKGNAKPYYAYGSKRNLDGNYEKVVTIGYTILKRVYVFEEGELKRVEFKRSIGSHPSSDCKLKSNESNVKLQSSCNVLSAANKVKHGLNKEVLSLSNSPSNNANTKYFTLEELSTEELWGCDLGNEEHYWDLLQEEKADAWSIANYKKKNKRRLGSTLSNRLDRRRNAKLRFSEGYKHLGGMIRFEEQEYYKSCSFADQDAKEEHYWTDFGMDYIFSSKLLGCNCVQCLRVQHRFDRRLKRKGEFDPFLT